MLNKIRLFVFYALLYSCSANNDLDLIDKESTIIVGYSTTDCLNCARVFSAVFGHSKNSRNDVKIKVVLNVRYFDEKAIKNKLGVNNSEENVSIVSNNDLYQKLVEKHGFTSGTFLLLFNSDGEIVYAADYKSIDTDNFLAKLDFLSIKS